MRERERERERSDIQTDSQTDIGTETENKMIDLCLKIINSRCLQPSLRFTEQIIKQE